MSSSSSQEKIHDGDRDSVEKMDDIDTVELGTIPYHGTAPNSQMELQSIRGFAFQSGRPEVELLLREEMARLPAGSSVSVEGKSLPQSVPNLVDVNV